MVNVAVSSTADQKIKAVQKAFLVSNKNVTVTGYKASSGINEQPNGNDEIILGCNNRLRETIEQTRADIYISIENGISYFENKWHDYAYVIMYFSKSHQEFTGFTRLVVFPTDCVIEARRRGFKLHTVGSVMAEMRPDINKQDPHLSLTGISRVDYLAETLNSLIIQADKLSLFKSLR